MFIQQCPHHRQCSHWDKNSLVSCSSQCEGLTVGDKKRKRRINSLVRTVVMISTSISLAPRAKKRAAWWTRMTGVIHSDVSISNTVEESSTSTQQQRLPVLLCTHPRNKRRNARAKKLSSYFNFLYGRRPRQTIT